MPLDGQKYEAPNLYDHCADIIERCGHVKGIVRDKATGAVCLMGAYQNYAKSAGLVVGVDIPDWDTFSNGMGFKHAVEAVLWNDHSAVTKEGVISRLRAAAQKMREALCDAI